MFLSFAANYDFGAAKVYFGYQHGRHAPVSVDSNFDNTSKYGKPTTSVLPFIGKYNAGTLGVSAPIGNGTLMASLAYRKGKLDVDNDVKVKWMTGAIGYKYNLSKRTYLYTDLAYGKEQWKDSDGKLSGKVTQFNLGLCHSF